MGQTLTHGIYLPDEGERNCYDGLASNWSILDGAVGTIAEHTTQIAGKANAVHTHTKADITDFPVYGNTAGTICEGNDSRLSDARTPVAHTHTKSDVTDLLNSNFIPSANNSYDLGSASKQWLNTYSKGYYYNGTAWGLDKANAWTAEQTCKASNPKWINRQNNVTVGVAPASNQTCAFYNYDKNGYELGRLITRVHSDGKTVTWISATNLYKNGSIDPTGTSIWANLYCAINGDGYPWVGTDCDFIPSASAIYNLGTATKRWKTLNGVNPGALSIPDGADSGANSSFNPDTTNWPKDGTPFQAIMPIVGWLKITIKNVAGNYAFVRQGTAGANLPWQIFADPTFTDFAEVTLNVPVTNVTYTIRINSSGGFTAKVYPCFGNV